MACYQAISDIKHHKMPYLQALAAHKKFFLRMALALAAVLMVDARGADLGLPPQRIVSLLPSLTESVCVLGACDRLVGVDRYSNWPASVRQLPQLGGGLDPSVEAIVALRPDLVLLAKSSRVVARLQALGLRVLVLEPKSYADMQHTLDALDQVLGTRHAPTVWREIEASVQAVAQSLPASVPPIRVYFEVNSAPYAAGESSFIGQTLTRLGVHNIVPAALGPFPQLNPEFVVRADPDVIMVGERSAPGLAQRPGWGHIRAVRNGHICRFTVEQTDLLVRPGPRMGEAAHIMADCLRERR